MLSRLKNSVAFGWFSFICAIASDLFSGLIAARIWLAAISIVFAIIAIVVGAFEFFGLFEEFEDYKGI